MYRPPTYLLVSTVLPVVYSLFRRYAPRDPQAESVEDDGRRLPYGAAGACMWALGLLIAVGGFYGLAGINRLWGSFDQQSILRIYPTKFIWAFAPGFAALLLPWLITLWGLRRLGYKAQAAEIVLEGNKKVGWNGERVMHWLGWGVVAPIVAFTIAAIPMHLSVLPDSVRVTHYAHVRPEVFYFVDATQAYAIDGYYLRDGSFERHPDLLIDFADGRRLSANAVGDGGTVPSQQLVNTLLERTGLQAVHVKTESHSHSAN
jgi:hypothetical protein